MNTPTRVEPLPAPQPSYPSAADGPRKQKKWVWLVGAPVLALALAAPAWNSALAAADHAQPDIAAPVSPLAVEFSPAKQDITSSQRNAIQSAQQYLDYSAFSRSGLIHQLEYEGFSTEDATFAVDSLNVDWNEQAAKCAKQYLDYTSFSRSGLIDQLVYDGFTRAQAEYGVNASY
ncbi:Ltp family lipoprotein [Nocardia sp. CDC153]|uniref:Ltp family lipoprotein n=1 Tax=Nocardia sp. CDC153 TaxID=3112167 RepID=UPI002DBF632B|nr:Ltp family lipoprotein [Nocardia sp. CDC153]MEC3953130.1 Ltp family lipoprotein [Nocardia sp. CDC153]